ncbi:3-deoxy-manno-octulosonate cytidylyltransferase (CMP-KDO synthetase) [Steroidobacter denitrificans]|uniref:3-deoxy-manno-octulosonate cytidylyltransferase n=1 Tax=Steroidobacter denitrificans TaxID=465721 RepID=A0A127FCI7_STEDE|nr:3-deoxy-manno-octulosonate cytidylyltransferase [Steroidobacter denitrificans]AMN47278.1 3-deoxy-manno-octulosonate cytidylyltransferase (CMP-KDO synthetase) [Steroidobacter denitrificans]
MAFNVVIPARYASTRLPAKPLLELGGRPMIQWVIEAALRSGAREVLVATDDVRIAAAAVDPRSPGRSLAVMTRGDHPSGTDRIAEVAAVRGWDSHTIVVNIQGDEPLLPPVLVDQVAALLASDARADIATLCTPIEHLDEFLNPNVVKVVTADDGAALYFSRAPIPWYRESVVPQAGGAALPGRFTGAQRHLGIYAYRVAALRRLTGLPPGELEQAEQLEQLRALQGGMRLLVGMACTPPPVGIDTQADLERLRARIEMK